MPFFPSILFLLHPERRRRVSAVEGLINQFPKIFLPFLLSFRYFTPPKALRSHLEECSEIRDMKTERNKVLQGRVVVEKKPDYALFIYLKA